MLTEAGLNFLAALIEKQPTLLGTLITRIDLGHATLSGISVLLDALIKAGEQGARLEELNLSYLKFPRVHKDGSAKLVRLGATHIQTLCRLVKGLPHLKRLGLGDHPLDQALPELAPAVASSNIVEWDLQSCGLTPAPLLANKAWLNPPGRELAINLSDNLALARANRTDQLELLETFAHQASRQQMLPHATLDWAAVVINADDVRGLVDLLNKHPAVLRELRCIDLSGARLEVDTLKTLLQVLMEQQGGGVRVLDLSSTRLRINDEWEPIPSADFPLLGQTVQACPALRVLRLARQTGPYDLRKQRGEAKRLGKSMWDRHSRTPQTDFSRFMAGVGSSGITHIDLSECQLCDDDLRNVRELRLPKKQYQYSQHATFEPRPAEEEKFAHIFDAVNAHACIEVLSPISDNGGLWQPIREKLSANAARRQAEENRLMELPLVLSAYDVPKEVVGKIMNYAMRL
ncbi:hypothetical protein [Variovorax sp. DT-64]|uniref:hypothetical protein n=1 Tax=Variovorax sp. DT-64 TaxID=3396160 RepID=UPI003F1AD8F7